MSKLSAFCKHPPFFAIVIDLMHWRQRSSTQEIHLSGKPQKQSKAGLHSGSYPELPGTSI